MINNHYTLYLRQGDMVSQDKLSRLSQRSDDVFFVPEGQRPEYKSFIHKEMKSDDLSSLSKAKILRESSMSLVEELFENKDIGKTLEESKQVISSFLDFMENEPEGMSHLIGLSGHDFYTYNHSLDVSIYALGLGQILGFSQDELRELGQGGIFHDIGKRQVPVEIICKVGGLNDVEWAQMQKHPQYGLKILNDHQVSDAVKACAFEHHENWSGNGYPQQLVADEIHPMARIIAISDCYDALTTKRSYNKPMPPTEAVNFIKEKLVAKYDPEVLNALYSVMFKMQEVFVKAN
jgi:putative nucleotidyltransferase with HDIG domain